MRRVLPHCLFSLSIVFILSCGGDRVSGNIEPDQSDYPPVSGSYSLKSSDCKTTTSPLVIRQNLAMLGFEGGFDYGVNDWAGYVLSDKNVYFTIDGTAETITCQASSNGTELAGSCSLASGGSCQFDFTRTGDVPPLSDQDGDGVPDDKDNCATVVNPDQADTNKDGIGDACQISECLVVSSGSDSLVPAASCSPPDLDHDGITDDKDNCPTVANLDQEDQDGDGLGDACDDDIDGDGFLNTVDPCPIIKNGQGSGKDFNNNLVPDECEDSDKDEIADGVDNCPFVANADQKDSNSNGVGDACANNDTDKDGINDDSDNCPYACNANQRNDNGNSRGDFCEGSGVFDFVVGVTDENDQDHNWVRDDSFAGVVCSVSVE